jgi:hypothetical protein
LKNLIGLGANDLFQLSGLVGMKGGSFQQSILAPLQLST